MIKHTFFLPGHHFDGVEFQPQFDRERLSFQMRRIYDLMVDGKWRTLREISESVSAPESSVSAQLRNLRKPRFGGHFIERRARGDRLYGLFEYRLGAKVK